MYATLTVWNLQTHKVQPLLDCVANSLWQPVHLEHPVLLFRRPWHAGSWASRRSMASSRRRPCTPAA